MRSVRPLILLLAGLLASGCAAQGGFSGLGPRDACGNPSVGSNTAVGAAAGALGGGLLGNMAGNRGGRNTRTLGGAVAGGLIGGIVGAMTEPAQAPCYPQGQYVPQPASPPRHYVPPPVQVPPPAYGGNGYAPSYGKFYGQY